MPEFLFDKDERGETAIDRGLEAVRYKPLSKPIRFFVGGCVERGDGSSFRRKAHAHNGERSDPYFGWICIRSHRRVLTPRGQPSRLVWHEVAHILTRQGHTARWREMAVALGVPRIEADSYIRKPKLLPEAETRE